MKKIILGLAVLLLLFSAVAGWYYFGVQEKEPVLAFKTLEEEDPLVRFNMEIFDIILANYWQKAGENELADLYKQALMTVATATPAILPTADRAGTAKMLDAAFKKAPGGVPRKDLALAVANVVLFNIPPQGRNGLLSQTEEQQFRDTVANIDRSKDLYEPLGLLAGASEEEVIGAYEARRQELESVDTPEAKEELERVEYSRRVLADENAKKLYDETQMEPTVSVEIVGKNTVYINMNKVSPASFGEFARVLEDLGQNPSLDRLIIDLRGNIGGSLDFVQYFMAMFLGPNQYVFDIFHQGDYQVQRTPTILALDTLKKIEEIAILTDEMTQSTAELTATVFQRFNMAKVVGTATRGWGTIENTYPIETQVETNQKHLVLLVNGLTLRIDGEPIEGRGVTPDIDIRDPDWKKKLSSEFKSQDLIDSVIGKY